MVMPSIWPEMQRLQQGVPLWRGMQKYREAKQVNNPKYERDLHEMQKENGGNWSSLYTEDAQAWT